MPTRAHAYLVGPGPDDVTMSESVVPGDGTTPRRLVQSNVFAHVSLNRIREWAKPLETYAMEWQRAGVAGVYADPESYIDAVENRGTTYGGHRHFDFALTQEGVAALNAVSGQRFPRKLGRIIEKVTSGPTACTTAQYALHVVLPPIKRTLYCTDEDSSDSHPIDAVGPVDWGHWYEGFTAPVTQATGGVVVIRVTDGANLFQLASEAQKQRAGAGAVVFVGPTEMMNNANRNKREVRRSKITIPVAMVAAGEFQEGMMVTFVTEDDDERAARREHQAWHQDHGDTTRDDDAPEGCYSQILVPLTNDNRQPGEDGLPLGGGTQFGTNGHEDNHGPVMNPYGGLTFFDGGIWHRGLSNRSSENRIFLTVVISAVARPDAPPLPRRKRKKDGFDIASGGRRGGTRAGFIDLAA